MALSEGLFLEYFLKITSLKRLHNIVTGLKNFVIIFHRDLFVSSKVIAFLCEDRFLPFLHTFLCITQETLLIFKIWSSHVKERLKTYQNHCRFYLKISFIRYKIDLLGQIDRFLPYFFRNIGPGQADYGGFMQFKLEYKLSSKKYKKFCFMVHMSYVNNKRDTLVWNWHTEHSCTGVISP